MIFTAPPPRTVLQEPAEITACLAALREKEMREALPIRQKHAAAIFSRTMAKARDIWQTLAPYGDTGAAVTALTHQKRTQYREKLEPALLAAFGENKAALLADTARALHAILETPRGSYYQTYAHADDALRAQLYPHLLNILPVQGPLPTSAQFETNLAAILARQDEITTTATQDYIEGYLCNQIEGHQPVDASPAWHPMPASRPFGVEIEGFFLTADTTDINGMKQHTQKVLRAAGIEADIIPENADFNSARWYISGDSSIKAPYGLYRPGQRMGIEVVTPKLYGEEGLAIYQRGADALYEAGFRANQSCGLHVHAELGKPLQAWRNFGCAYNRRENASRYQDLLAPVRRGPLAFNGPNLACSETDLLRAESAAAIEALLSPQKENLPDGAPERGLSWLMRFNREYSTAEWRGKEGQGFEQAGNYIRRIVNFTDRACANPNALL